MHKKDLGNAHPAFCNNLLSILLHLSGHCASFVYLS
jgi:hypothetical protein